MRIRTPLRAVFFFSLALTLLGSTVNAPQAAFAGPSQQNAPLRPDPVMTPGGVLPVTKEDICVPGYSKKVRNVPIGVKRKVYDAYGITQHKTGEYEIDHLISLQLGGSNSVKNLWPQSYLTQPWNAHVKDALENRLHSEVCKGHLDLATAQREIATDWIAAYQKYFRTQLPLTKGAGRPRASRRSPFSASPAVQSGTGGKVWVNLKSGKYFPPGSRYYGKTKEGLYLSEADAQSRGYVAAKGR